MHKMMECGAIKPVRLRDGGSKVRFEFKDHFTLVEERKRMVERYVAGYYLLSEFNVA